MPAIQNAKILVVATNGFEQSELETPRDKLVEHGATVHVASTDGKDIRGWDGSDWGREVKADLSFADVDVGAYDALVLPGGQINPDLLRLEPRAIEIVQGFHRSAKPVAAICHAPWLLIEAGLLKGVRATSYGSIRTDLRNAGAEVVDEAVVTDNGITTSRNPGDLDAFVERIVREVEADATGSAAA